MNTPRTDALITTLIYVPTRWAERIKRLGFPVYTQWRVGFHGAMYVVDKMTRHAMTLERELNDAREMLASYQRVNANRGCKGDVCATP